MTPTDALVDAIATAVAERLTNATAARADLPVTWTVPETMRQTGLGRETIYDLIRRGELDAIRIDPTVERSKLLVFPESVIAWRDRQRNIQAPPAHPARPKGSPRAINAGAKGDR